MYLCLPVYLWLSKPVNDFTMLVGVDDTYFPIMFDQFPSCCPIPPLYLSFFVADKNFFQVQGIQYRRGCWGYNRLAGIIAFFGYFLLKGVVPMLTYLKFMTKLYFTIFFSCVCRIPVLPWWIVGLSLFSRLEIATHNCSNVLVETEMFSGYVFSTFNEMSHQDTVPTPVHTCVCCGGGGKASKRHSF